MQKKGKNKFEQLGDIVNGGKKSLLEKVSKKSVDGIAQSIAGTYPQFLKEALSQIFKPGLAAWQYTTGEHRATQDFRVKDDRMDINKIADRQEGLEAINVIEEYLEGELGLFSSPLLGIKRAPLQDKYSPKLILFYSQLCQKYIYDLQVLKDKNQTIKKFLINGLFDEKAIIALEEYQQIFEMSKEEVFKEIEPEIHRILAGYIDIDDEQFQRKSKSNNNEGNSHEDILGAYARAMDEARKTVINREKNELSANMT